MTPRRFLLLLVPALPLAPLMLALAACGGGHGESGERRKEGRVPLGFEMAMAGLDADDAAGEPPAAAR
jgi:hypothetical protein